MHRFHFLIVGLSLIALTATCAQAAPISFFEREGLDDLPAGGALPNFVLDVGSNTVSGSFSATDNFAQMDRDSFAFTVPAGLEVLSLKVVITERTGAFTNSTWILNIGSATAGQVVPLDLQSVAAFDDAFFSPMPLAAQTYNLQHTTFGSVDGNATSGDYTFVLDVHQIPEPTSLALAALGSLALVRRKR